MRRVVAGGRSCRDARAKSAWRRRLSFPGLVKRAVGGAAIGRFARTFRRIVTNRSNRLILRRRPRVYGFQPINPESRM